MVKYYTAVGKIGLGKDSLCVKQNGQEYALTVTEAILWTNLSWTILNEEDLKRNFESALEQHRICEDISFKQLLGRLITRGLVVSGEDYLAVDALYNLVAKLRITPICQASIAKRIMTLIYFWQVKRVPFEKSKRHVFPPEMTPEERKVLAFTRRISATPAEIILLRIDKLEHIQTEDEFVEKVYEQDLDYQNLPAHARFNNGRHETLNAIVNLYLKKQIYFEQV